MVEMGSYLATERAGMVTLHPIAGAPELHPDYRWAGYGAPKSCNQDADALDLAEGNMTGGANASP